MSLIISALLLCVSILSAYFSKFWTGLDNYKIVLTILTCVSFGASAAFFVAFVNRSNRKKIHNLQNRLEMWNSISYHVDQAGDEVFNSLPIGIIIYDVEQSDNKTFSSLYRVKWANEYAKQIFENDILERNIEDINIDLSRYVLNHEPKVTLAIGDKMYDFTHKVSNHIIYLFEETEREKLRKRYNDRISAIGVMNLDNIDESLKSYDIQTKSNFRGDYYGKISDWMSNYGVYIQSIEDNRLVFLLEKSSLNKMLEDKFDILDKVHEISNNNHLNVTLSIGIACYDTTKKELGTLAQNALDLAEKRGGDQVVVNIENENIKYFGGQTSAVEDDSYIATRVRTSTLIDLINKSDKVYIMTHNLADCDAIGSSIGVSRIVEAFDKNFKIIIEKAKCDVTVQKIFNIISDEKRELLNMFASQTEVSEVTKNSLLIMCDTQGPDLAMFPELLQRFDRVAVFDHHRASDKDYEHKIFDCVQTSSSSTVELIAEMYSFVPNDIKLSSLEASIMLAGLVVDTNNFTYRTSSRTFEACSTLKRYGADMVVVRKLLRDNAKQQQQVNQAALGAEIYLERFAIAKLSETDEAFDRTILARISDTLLETNDVEAAFTIGHIKTSPSDVGVSARSYDAINVQLIMEEMEGGGHLNSAATQIKNTTVEEVYDRLCTILDKEYGGTDEVMEVILLKDVKGKGNKDEIIKVANGYANFLVSNNLAVIADDKSIKELEERKKAEAEEEKRQRILMQKLKSEIDGKSVNVYIKIGKDGKAFGSVTTKKISDEFYAQNEIRIDRHKISLPAEINSVGIYPANVKLAKDVVAEITVNVSREE